MQAPPRMFSFRCGLCLEIRRSRPPRRFRPSFATWTPNDQVYPFPFHDWECQDGLPSKRPVVALEVNGVSPVPWSLCQFHGVGHWLWDLPPDEQVCPRSSAALPPSVRRPGVEDGRLGGSIYLPSGDGRHLDVGLESGGSKDLLNPSNSPRRHLDLGGI